MPRYNFVLPESLFQALKDKAYSTGLSMSDHVRRSLDGYLFGQVLVFPLVSGVVASGLIHVVKG